MKTNQITIIVVTLVSVLGVAFYWYEFRPAQIRQECSLVKKYSDFVPGLTQEQADKENVQCLQGKNDDSRVFNKYKVCDKKTPYPAHPAKTWDEPASTSQYQSCIHSRGL